MRRALRIALKTVTWVAIVGCTGMFVVVLINLRDEALTPEAQSLAEFHRPSLPDEQNAYLALVGFDAPSDGDPIAAGVQIVEKHDADAAADPMGAQRAERMTLWAVREGHLKFVVDKDSLCDPISKPCLQPSLTDPAQLRAMAEANK